MAKSTRSTSTDPVGKSTETPVAFLTGAEIVTVLPFAAEMLATHGPAAGRALLNAFKRDEHIFSQIRASWKTGDDYLVVLSLRNLTEHGIYIERMWIHSPKDTPLMVGKAPDDQANMSFGGTVPKWVQPEQVFPKLLEAGSAKSLTLMLKLNDFKSEKGVNVLTSTAQVEIKFDLSKLDESKSKSHSLKVRLRSSPHSDA